MTGARRFLWVVAIITIIIIAAAILWRLASDRMMRMAFTPTVDFAESAVSPPPDYAMVLNWISRPGMAEDPARWTPEGFRAAPRPAAAVFFISPTAWLGRSRWNAPLDDVETNERLETFTRMQASVFNGVAAVWVPRYRQATFGAFLKRSPDSERALDLAYGDVERAFDHFLAEQSADTPIILAGHSQGSRHLLHLLQRRSAQLEGRLVAAYAVGWTLALPDDLQAIGLPLCSGPEQTACVLSWQSFAFDGDLEKATPGFAAVPDVAGTPLGTRAMACTNPLTGGGGDAGPEANAGMLVNDRLIPRRVGARCNDRGFLLIAPPPKDIGSFVLPDGNFHVYDYSLFWANVRADVEARLSAFGAARMAPKDMGAADSGAADRGRAAS